MTSPRDFFDFDAWEAENTAAPIRFHLLGKDWDLPGDIPAAVMLRMYKLERLATTGQVPDGVDLADITVEGMVRDFVGDTILQAWLEAGMTNRMMQAVAHRLYQIHSGANPATDDDQPETPDDFDGPAVVDEESGKAVEPSPGS